MHPTTRIYKLMNDSGKYTHLPLYKAKVIIQEGRWHDLTEYKDGEQPLESLIALKEGEKAFEEALPSVSAKPLKKKAGKKNATNVQKSK